MGRRADIFLTASPTTIKALEKWLYKNPLHVWMVMNEKISQHEIAVMVGYTQGAISRWLNGWKLPPMRQLIELAEATGEEPGEFQRRWVQWYNDPPLGTRTHRREKALREFNPVHQSWLNTNPLVRWLDANKRTKDESVELLAAYSMTKITFHKMYFWLRGDQMPPDSVIEDMATMMKADYAQLHAEWSKWATANPHPRVEKSIKIERMLSEYEKKEMRAAKRTPLEQIEIRFKINDARRAELAARMAWQQKHLGEVSHELWKIWNEKYEPADPFEVAGGPSGR